MTKDRRGPAIRRLVASQLPRSYWMGTSLDDPRERWWFECIDDAGELWVVRQFAIDADGRSHAYSADHLEDDWGFLTDQPLSVDEGDLRPIDAATFDDLWRGRATVTQRADGRAPALGTDLSNSVLSSFPDEESAGAGDGPQ